MTRATPITPELTVVDGVPTTTSLDIARHSGKRHNHVLCAIRDLIAQAHDRLQADLKTAGQSAHATH
ncbi:MAG: hypothetical protein A2486_05240 [Burkholderiales bacterium RIFOXYC12_FULL_65_23]|uniref:hypothetical protein n=1 Tax=Malikia spinosa TaxID=86180 RepID=UPI0008AAFD59|nr:hypothetical protein [Malikia spinosa]OGB70270.1 MAG: hypothetical protein A2486_05240 [Burkholderiales bacterium RIFOXYC12_FULL_65_23]